VNKHLQKNLIYFA